MDKELCSVVDSELVMVLAEPVVVTVGGVEFGGNRFTVIAGPCAVESRDQLLSTALSVKKSNASVLRGGAFKPRSSPYSFQGLAEEGLKLLAEARDLTGLPVITEVLDTRQVELVARYADVLQVGSRNMQNFALLKEVGISMKPILLKRGMMATVEEFLLAAEYILKQGNNNIILCERGIRTFETSTRNTLDLSAVLSIKQRTGLPVIVDPSHGTGVRWMVPSMSKAALAVGADGLIIEVHINPEAALCDGHQSVSTTEFDKLMNELKLIAPVVGKKMQI